MNRRVLLLGMLLGMLLMALSACGMPGGGDAPAEGEDAASEEVAEEAETDAETDEAEAETPTPFPTTDLSGLFDQSEEGASELDLSSNVSGIGEVKTDRDAELVFTVGGTVEHVYVEEGEVVTKGQVLASLDLRTFDQQIAQAEAGVKIAEANAEQLDEPPRAADIQAANAQIRQAEAGLALVQEPPREVDVKAAQANVTLAEVNLQATRDQMSYAKTQSELQVKQSVFQLTQAQWNYALAQRYWEHADDHETDPVVPNTTGPTGQSQPNVISEGQEAQYRTQFEQAKASMQQAEEALNLALVAAEGSRKSEVTGVQAAEKRVEQAKVQLEQLLAPPGENNVAQSQAGIDAAVANRSRLYPDPTGSSQKRANASIEQAQSALELAKLNREYAELRAPFEGIVSDVNVDPGDPGMGARAYDIKVVDMENLLVEVDISDVDIAKIEVGQEAIAVAEALPGTEYEGEVIYIAPLADVVGNVRTFRVKVKLEETQRLRPGMSVRVELLGTDADE